MENSHEKLFSLANLEEISGGSNDFIQQMLKMFIDQANNTIRGFKEGLAEKNYKLIRDLAHQIKPSIDNLKIDSLTSLIREVEKKAENDANPHTLAPLIQENNAKLALVISQLEQEIENL
jgi:HPt (histidine-containing phosphotransfer) domain-containing protein